MLCDDITRSTRYLTKQYIKILYRLHQQNKNKNEQYGSDKNQE